MMDFYFKPHENSFESNKENFIAKDLSMDKLMRYGLLNILFDIHVIASIDIDVENFTILSK